MEPDNIPVAGKISQVYADGAIMQSSDADTKIFLANEVVMKCHLSAKSDSLN